jgi:hypothetical protein
MTDPIDPQLSGYGAASQPPRGLQQQQQPPQQYAPQQQPYPPQPQGLPPPNAAPGQPYYTSQAQQHPSLVQQHAPPVHLDPQLGGVQTSPSGHGASPLDGDDDEDHDGDDGYATPRLSSAVAWLHSADRPPSSTHDTPGTARSPGTRDVKRARACDSCRGLKVKCDQDDLRQPCKRCAKANRQWHVNSLHPELLQHRC